MRPTMKRIEASSQSPVSTSTSRPVPRMPSVAKIERKRFLPRITSEIVPRIGESTATMKSEMLNPRAQ